MRTLGEPIFTDKVFTDKVSLFVYSAVNNGITPTHINNKIVLFNWKEIQIEL
jgi:hypothetical protein